MALFLLLILVGAAGAAQQVERSIGDPAGAPLSGDALDEATYQLADRLRCPVCQGLSVAASPSPSALAMREEIRELLAQGYSDEQIVDYFEGAYGEFVRLVPKPKGFNLLVWILPMVGVLAGLFLVLRLVKRTPGLDAQDAAEDATLDAFREKVRAATAAGREEK
jgi:cytochrome c-type biogenesis protein CcmH